MTLKMIATVALSLALLAVGTPSPQLTPDPTPTLKTIIRVRSSPLCTTIKTNVLYTLEGLHANDDLVASSKPVLAKMGKEFEPNGLAGQLFDKQQEQWETVPGGTHDTNPALDLDNVRLKQLVGQIVHNIAVIDAILNNPKRFPAVARSDDDAAAMLLKARLQAVADQQKRNLNVLYGLTDTFSLQELIAKGDGTQGVLNEKFNATGPIKNIVLSDYDQDVSFKDVTTGPDRWVMDRPKNPTVDTAPQVSEPGTDLSNNPMARFYNGVSKIQQTTSQAEDVLTQTLQGIVDSCR
jgi:hypothetical protein